MRSAFHSLKGTWSSPGLVIAGGFPLGSVWFPIAKLAVFVFVEVNPGIEALFNCFKLLERIKSRDSPITGIQAITQNEVFRFRSKEMLLLRFSFRDCQKMPSFTHILYDR